MSEMILTEENFEKEVLHSDRPVIVDFYAPWCGPCNRMSSVIRSLDEEADGQYVVGKVNIDEAADLAMRFNVMSIPTIKVFKNGEVAATFVGVTGKEKIRSEV